MILHARPTRRLTASAQWVLVLIGLVVLPLSATAQVVLSEPVKPAEAPTVELRPTAAQTAAVAPAAEVAVPAHAANSVVRLVPIQATVAKEDTSVQSDTERRLQRLEKMMESILAELKNRPTDNPSNRSSRLAASDSSASSYRIAHPVPPSSAFTLTKPARSLADLKKQRIDIEEHLQNLQDQLSKLDEQIARLQSARSKERPENPLQAK